MSNTEQKKTEEENKFIDQWMIRPCSIYKEEYNECTSLRGRFHQYFIHGRNLDCSAWKQDYNNCNIWEENESEKAYEALIKNETERRRQRLRGHYGNTVWKKRMAPPENWSAPLPEWMKEKIENSAFYHMKLEETRRQTEQIEKYCSIM